MCIYVYYKVEIVFIFSIFASSDLSYFLSHFLELSKLLNYLSLNGEPQNTRHERLVLDAETRLSTIRPLRVFFAKFFVAIFNIRG